MGNEQTCLDADTEYAFLRSQKKRKVAAGGSATTQLAEFRDADLQELFEGPTDEEIAQARTDLAELGLTFESDMDSQSSVSFAPQSPVTAFNSFESGMSILCQSRRQVSSFHGLRASLRLHLIA